MTKIINNNFILKKKISSGSFGVVFSAVTKNLKEFVAVKIEKDSPEEESSIDREVFLLNKLQGI